MPLYGEKKKGFKRAHCVWSAVWVLREEGRSVKKSMEKHDMAEQHFPVRNWTLQVVTGNTFGRQCSREGTGEPGWGGLLHRTYLLVFKLLLIKISATFLNQSSNTYFLLSLYMLWKDTCKSFWSYYKNKSIEITHLASLKWNLFLSCKIHFLHVTNQPIPACKILQ